MPENLVASFTAVNPAAIDALVRANRVAARGFEQFARQWIDTARQTVEGGLSVQSRFATANSLADYAALQGQLVHDGLEALWSQGRAFSELGTTVAREVAACFTVPTTQDTEASTKPTPRKAA